MISLTVRLALSLLVSGVATDSDGSTVSIKLGLAIEPLLFLEDGIEIGSRILKR